MKRSITKLLFVSALFVAPTSALAFDADSDGTKDALDAYPCEANAVGAAFYPAQGDHGMMVFEDLWPVNGDRDYNDAAIAYNYIYKLDGAGDVIQIRATLNVLALGAEIRSGLGLSLPIARGAVASVRMTRWDKHKNEEISIHLMPSQSDANLTFTISSDMREFFDGYGGGINTTPGDARLEGETIEIWIDMWQPTSFPVNQAPYDLFIFRTANPSHEVHRPEYPGTSNMDTSLFNSGDDGSSPSRRFVNVNGLPFALVFPTLVPYPSEGTRIDTLYPNITAWAASGGTTNQDFYTNGVVAAAAYQDVNGLGAPTPGFIGPADLPAETGCIQDWGLAVHWGSMASRYSYGAVVNLAGQATTTGYTQGAFNGQSNAGGLDAFVAQYDTVTGNLLWVQQFGSAGDDSGRDIAHDASGNIYVVGDTEGAIAGLTPSGGRDAFIMKLSPTGTVLWTRLFGGAGSDSGNGIAVDNAGNVYIAGGSTSNALPGATSPNNTPASYVAKFDANGTHLWTQHYIADSGHGSNTSYAMDVETRPSTGAVFVVGTERRYNIDANAAYNQYLARHDPQTGAMIWLEHVGVNGYRLSPVDFRYAYGFGVAVDDVDGSAYIVGDWYGNGVPDWNGWSRGVGDTSPDATIAKFGPDGTALWRYPIASSDAQEDFAWGVISDGAGGAVYVTGRTLGTMPGQTNFGVTDYFVRAFSYDGTERWTTQGGSFAWDSGHIAAVYDTTQNGGIVYVVGNTTSLESNGWSTWDIIMSTLDVSNGAIIREQGANRLRWEVGPAGACSTTCGNGTTSRTVTCVLPDGTAGQDSDCASLTRPGPDFPCWDYSYCSQTWATSAWNSCSTTCGTGTQVRNVFCRRDDGITLPDYDCSGEQAPSTVQSCTNTTSCSYGWVTGAWSACNAAACSTGNQTRSVSCVRSDGAVVANSNCSGAAPSTTQSCADTSCAGASCAQLRSNGVTTNGNYEIDPDGPGGQAPRTVWCDMTYQGGGWTNLDFTNNRVVLANGNYVQCSDGLSANNSSITCGGPYVNGNTTQWLYHYLCNGTDRSADYIIDHMAPLLGHRLSANLGFSSQTQNYNGSHPPSTGDREYCYINGQWQHHTSCAPYGRGNGNCTPSFFTLTR